jgi:hypothetical protein
LSGQTIIFKKNISRKLTFSWANFEKKVNLMKVVLSSHLDPEFEGAALELAGWGITLSKVKLINF